MILQLIFNFFILFLNFQSLYYRFVIIFCQVLCFYLYKTCKNIVIVGVTGVIGSGKSTVCSMLKEMGGRKTVVVMDKLVARLYKTQLIVSLTTLLLGKDYIDPTGVNKQKLKECFFKRRTFLQFYIL